MEKKTLKIDYSRDRLASQADKNYNEGKYLAALRLAYEELNRYGGDGDVYARLSDIYEGMGLYASALNWWYRFLDVADEEDLPDVYEGLAVNYMNMGKEAQAAYYYKHLMDADETLPPETKMEIADAFSKEKGADFRFVHPPELADYSKELDVASRALKAGDCNAVLRILEPVAKGSKEYPQAQEMRAVAYLLLDQKDKAEEICNGLLSDKPDEVRVLATLAAVYLEQGKEEESRAIALKLYEQSQENTDDLYKVATVCCENGLHEQAYEKFRQLEEKLPYDGRMLYFKGVAAYKSGKLDEAERTFDTLCTVYPDAEVAKYYLRRLRLRGENAESGEKDEAEAAGEDTEPTYFYHLPQAERENRARTLLYLSKAAKEEAMLLGFIAAKDGLFRWCFDELDGGDIDLQYLAIVAAERAHEDEFLREVLLDCEVADVLKIETLRLLFGRNKEEEVGMVLYHIYHKVEILPVKLGRKRHKKFLEAYARVASKFGFIAPNYGRRLVRATEDLYGALEKTENFGLVTNSDDLSCAIFLLSGIKEANGQAETAAPLFDADPEKVRALLAAATSRRFGFEQNRKEEERE